MTFDVCTLVSVTSPAMDLLKHQTSTSPGAITHSADKLFDTTQAPAYMFHDMLYDACRCQVFYRFAQHTQVAVGSIEHVCNPLQGCRLPALDNIAVKHAVKLHNESLYCCVCPERLLFDSMMEDPAPDFADRKIELQLHWLLLRRHH